MFNYDILNKRHKLNESAGGLNSKNGNSWEKNAASVYLMRLSYKILVESDEPGFPMIVKNENSLDHPFRLIIFMWLLFFFFS